MQAIRESNLYRICAALVAWCTAEWRKSALVGWFVSQRETPGHNIGRSILEGYRKAFRTLRLNRLLEGSVFLHPAVFACAAAVLAPLLPTMASLALVCASFFALVMRLGTDRLVDLRYSPLHKYVLLFAGIYLYATVTSTTPSGSLFAGLLTALFVLFFLVLPACGLDNRQLRLLVTCMVIAGVLVALYGFYQRLFPDKFHETWLDEDKFSDISFRVYSTLENPNVLGEYFLLIIPIGAAMVLAEEQLKSRLLFGAGTLAMIVCLILTYSRGCYLGLIAAVAVFLVLLDRRFLLLGLAALVLSPFLLPENVLTRFTSIGDMSDSSTSYRVYIWLGTLAMLRDYWFSGVGPGINAFNTVYPEYAYNTVTAPHAHNLFLQVTCDTGVCGLAVLILLCVSFYRMMFTAMHREGDRRAKLLQTGAVSAVTGFLVQSMTDYTFYNYRVLLLFWVVLALSVLFTRMGWPKEVTR